MADPVIFGRYLLRRRLAMGGMGEVYVAEQTGVGDFRKPLAIKLMLPGLEEDPKQVGLFLAEARLAARLQHPNVVQVFDAGVIEGRYFLAMELVDGVSLSGLARAARLANRKVDEDVLCLLARQTLEALRYVHELVDEAGAPLDLVHRDISPSNILVSTRGEVKLTDFGIAKVRDSENYTAPGELRGKMAYFAPELLQGAKATPHSDLYALGVTLYRLAALASPFSRTDESDLLSALRRELVPLVERRADLSPLLIATIERALATDPAKRFESAAVMLEAFPRGDLEVRQQKLRELVMLAAQTPSPVIITPPPVERPPAMADPEADIDTRLAATRVREPEALTQLAASLEGPGDAGSKEPGSAPLEAPVARVVASAVDPGAAAAQPSRLPDSTVDSEARSAPLAPQLGTSGRPAAVPSNGLASGVEASTGEPRPEAPPARAGAAALALVMLAVVATLLVVARHRAVEDGEVAPARPPANQRGTATVHDEATAERAPGATAPETPGLRTDEARASVDAKLAAAESTTPVDGVRGAAPAEPAPGPPSLRADGERSGAHQDGAGPHADGEPRPASVEPTAARGGRPVEARADTPQATGKLEPTAAVAPTRKALSPPATLVIDAAPWANVELDGKVVGQTPLRLPVPSSPARLRLTNAAFKPVSQTLRLSAGEERKVFERLTPR